VNKITFHSSFFLLLFKFLRISCEILQDAHGKEGRRRRTIVLLSGSFKLLPEKGKGGEGQ
jgi:hypothetical protein